MADTPIQYMPCALSAYEAVDEANHVYSKELIYADDFLIRHEKASYEDFQQDKPGARISLSVGPDAITGWETVGNLMLSRGVDILIPRGHKVKEDNILGKVVKYAKKKNKEGKDALYADIKFEDADKAKEGLSANVSIYAEPEFTDGKGNKYSWPITHVASTKSPMIPALEPYTAIAASMITEIEPEKEKKTMATKVKPTPKTTKTIDELLKANGIEVPENATEEEKKNLLQEYLGDYLPVQQIEKTTTTTEKPVEKVAASAVMLSMLSKGRKAEIDALVADDRITPAQSDVLKKKWCSDEAIKIACAAESGDGFDDQIEVLKLNEKLKSGSVTGPQAIELSKDKTTGESSLQRDARLRREKAEKQYDVIQ
jgi:hypothetical protein